MSNLSNLMISGSYRGLINLQDSTQNLASQSGDIQLQDGLGDNVGASINASTTDWRINNALSVGSTLAVTSSAYFNSDVIISGSLLVTGSKQITGSVDILGDLTVTGDVSAETGSFDTIHTRVLHVTTETASVIFSSGSNKLGDEETDRQDLIGQVIVSGTLGVEGNSAFTGSLTVSNEISSSTVNGIGNVTTYSSSVDDRLTQLEVSSGSQASQLSNLENFTASQENINSGINTFTASIDSRFNSYTSSTDNRLDNLEADTGSQDQRLDSLEAFTGSQETINGFYNSFTASNGNDSLNSYTASQDIINSNVLNFTSSQESINGFFNQHTQSLNDYTASTDSRLDNIESFTASLATDFVTTGSFNSYTSSTDNRLDNLEATTSSFESRFTNIESTTASLQTEIDGLSSKTGSYATTGSNTFDGDQVFSGSVQGDVHTITIASSTASIDCSQGNFFDLTNNESGSTHLIATNVTGGRTITLRITKTDTDASFDIDTGSIKFPSGNSYTISAGNNVDDVITFVSFDNTALYAVAGKNFV